LSLSPPKTDGNLAIFPLKCYYGARYSLIRKYAVSWFSRVRAPKPATEETERLQLPGGLWSKCPKCSTILYNKELSRNDYVCTKCSYHFRLNAQQRIDLLCDRNSFEELAADLRTTDPLSFKDSKRYRERLKAAERSTEHNEACRYGKARVNGIPISIGVMDFFFMGGSMGMVVGEKLTRAAELAYRELLPLVIVSASGGARMQEGIFSLMQMAKISAAISRLSERRVPYISILTDPTTGGVAASYAMQGDVIISEPGALIGFAGPRVIEQTIKKKLPEGFQRAEFLLEHGMVDIVCPRSELKDTLASVVELLRPKLKRAK
jgi:acetyl-CoA carboxylase carboxyl transferase subunit beta